jgi:hypothetical protein
MYNFVRLASGALLSAESKHFRWWCASPDCMIEKASGLSWGTPERLDEIPELKDFVPEMIDFSHAIHEELVRRLDHAG